MAVSVAGLSAKEAMEKRNDILTNVQKMGDERADNWTAEDEKQFDEMMSDAEKLADHAKRTKRIELAESLKMDDTQADHQVTRPNPQGGTQLQSPDEQPAMVAVRRNSAKSGHREYHEVRAGQCGSHDYQEAFGDYIRTGRAMSPLREVQGNGGLASSQAIQSDRGPQAGFLIASEQFAAGILKEVDDLLFIRMWAKIHSVREAGSLGITCRDKRANTFGWGAELQVQNPDTKLKYGKRTLSPHPLTGSAQISRDLMRRTLGGAEAEVRSELSRDASEVMEDAYMTGDGVGKPLGLFTPSDDGISTSRDVNTGANDGFTLDGLLMGKYSLKSQYRRGQRGPVRWLIHRLGIRKVVLLKDLNGQPLFRIGAGVQQDTQLPEDEMLGFPVDESERCPSTYTAGQYVAMLCNYRYYEIADALDMEIQVLDQIAARQNLIEYIGRLKTDGMPTLQEAFVRFKCGTLP